MARHAGWTLPLGLGATLLGLLGGGVMVWQASDSAFSGTTVNPNNAWTAGAVSLTDDDSGSAMFTSTGMTPTTGSVQKCIAVTYGGSVSAPVKLYGATPGGTGFGTYLNLTIEVGTVGSFSSCGAFSGSSIYSGTVATFGAARTNYGNGLATTWTPTGTGQSRVFRFTVSVVDDNNGNGLTCTMPFTWEAQG
jgi:hypothetical protein